LTSQAEQFNQRNIDEFRASHGRVGGTFAGAPLFDLRKRVEGVGFEPT
jgi:hypothetical protein